MMYSEFVEGTGCRDNEHNYKVFKDLEVMYMNSDLSKAQIYEYGKKLVDNTVVKTAEQIKLEQEINEQIDEHKTEIKKLRGWIADCQKYVDYWKEQGDKEMVAFYRNSIKTWKQEAGHHRNEIAALKWVLEA